MEGVEHDRDYYASIPPFDFKQADSTSPNDVIYKLFSSLDNGYYVNSKNVNKFQFNRTIPTIFLIHGWTTDDTSPWYEPLRNNLLNSIRCNVVYVNWSKAGNKTYFVSSANIKPVGKFIAEFLISAQIDPKYVHLIGHSLGSHLAGFVGKATKELTNKKIGRITALDPAGPSFEHPQMPIDMRLNREDADFVDVIHTDIQYYGFTAPLGHVDFYPNFGKEQPGCPARSKDDNCNHARSTLYLIESIKNKVYAKKGNYVQNDKEVEINAVVPEETVVFGYFVDLQARGVFYMETNDAVPFLK